MDDQNTQPQAAGSKMPVLIISVVVLILIGAVAFFAMQSSNQAQPTVTEQPTDTSTTGDNMTTEPTTAIDGAEATDPAMQGEVREFTVEGSAFKFSMPEIRVRKGDTVRVTFVNTQGIHDFVLDEFNAQTKQLQSGQSETIEFVADQAGTFEYYCSVGNHRQMGMVGNLIVE